MELFPSIDLRGGRVVRLWQGDFDKETVYGTDPIAVAEAFCAAGARWIHVVDLDAARGDGSNLDTMLAIAEAVPAAIEGSGGVRDGALLVAGIDRVVIGSMAVSNPPYVAELVSEYPGRVAVGLDHRDGTLAGPDLEGLASVLETTTIDVVASGGVSSLADIEALTSLEASGRRLAGVIVGRALYEGAFTVEEAMAACAACA